MLPTGNSKIRTLHGITWKDELAWMEDMKGKEWKKVLTDAQEIWKGQTKGLDDIASIFQAEITASSYISHLPFFQANQIKIASVGTTFIHWSWEDSEKIYTAADLDTCKVFPNFTWVIEEVKEAKGAEVYQFGQ